MSYDSPTTREVMVGEAGGAATTEYNKFRSFEAARLKKVVAFVTTAGTAAGHGFNIFHGTTSIGTIALSTNTAQASLVGPTAYSSPLLNELLASGDQISVKSLADTVGKAAIVYVYEVSADVS